ncbi:MAG: putative type II secretion system protein F [Myxococcota bacterium]|nr:putative type II secretion system protein F [Myxococcota bacterium]
MPVYAYKGLNAAGKTVSGIREVESAKALRTVLRKDGVFLTDVREEKKGEERKGEVNLQRAFSRVSSAELAMMTRQLATLIGAGIPLVDAINALSEQVENPNLVLALSQIKQQVNEGASLADAMSGYPKIFSNLYVSMIQAGESSGALEVVLERLADFTENQSALRSKLITTMAYPVIMMIVGAGVLTTLFVFVVPKITKVFQDLNAQLPLITRILIWFSETMASYWWLILLMLISGVLGFRRWVGTPRGRSTWDAFTLRAPIFGPLVRLVAISRFSRTLATLLSSGVPLLKALDIVRNIVANSVLAGVIEQTREAVKEGAPLAEPIRRSGQFPPIVTHMIAVGEKSGELEGMLNKVSDAYDRQVNMRISLMTTILEPLMIVGMGVVAGFIIISILLPIMQINQFVK